MQIPPNAELQGDIRLCMCRPYAESIIMLIVCLPMACLGSDTLHSILVPFYKFQDVAAKIAQYIEDINAQMQTLKGPCSCHY